MAKLIELRESLAESIVSRIRAEGWNQSRAAYYLCCTQPEVSRLVNGRVSGFSLDRLLTYLNLLGADATLLIDAAEKPTPRRPSELGVTRVKLRSGHETD